MKHGATTLALMAAMLCGLGVFGAPVSASESTRPEAQNCRFECCGHGHLSGCAGGDDVFRLIVPLNDEYSADRAFAGELPQTKADQETVSTRRKVNDGVNEKVNGKVNERQRQIIASISSNPHITQIELAAKLGISVVHVNKNMKKLQDLGIIRRVGPDKGGHWEVVG